MMVTPIVTPVTHGRIVTHPVFPDQWQVRLPCSYSSGEMVAFTGTLPGCVEYLGRHEMDR